MSSSRLIFHIRLRSSATRCTPASRAASLIVRSRSGIRSSGRTRRSSTRSPVRRRRTRRRNRSRRITRELVLNTPGSRRSTLQGSDEHISQTDSRARAAHSSPGRVGSIPRSRAALSRMIKPESVFAGVRAHFLDGALFCFTRRIKSEKVTIVSSINKGSSALWPYLGCLLVLRKLACLFAVDRGSRV